MDDDPFIRQDERARCSDGTIETCGQIRRLAGTILFSLERHEWFTRGNEVYDWEFGIVRAGAAAEENVFNTSRKFGQDNSTLPHRALTESPMVSVIVCSYNGARTLAECLISFLTDFVRAKIN